MPEARWGSSAADVWGRRTDEWLHDQPWEWSCHEYDGHAWLAEAQWEKVRWGCPSDKHTGCAPKESSNVPYDISTLQKICTPRRPTVRVGRWAHRGPEIRATPLNLRSSLPCSWASGKEEAPVMVSVEGKPRVHCHRIFWPRTTTVGFATPRPLGHRRLQFSWIQPILPLPLSGHPVRSDLRRPQAPDEMVDWCSAYKKTQLVLQSHLIRRDLPCSMTLSASNRNNGRPSPGCVGHGRQSTNPDLENHEDPSSHSGVDSPRFSLVPRRCIDPVRSQLVTWLLGDSAGIDAHGTRVQARLVTHGTRETKHIPGLRLTLGLLKVAPYWPSKYRSLSQPCRSAQGKVLMVNRFCPSPRFFPVPKVVAPCNLPPI